MPSSTDSETLEVRDGHSTDVEKLEREADFIGDREAGSPGMEKEQADEARPVEDSRPGAKAGLTLTQFWIALAGYS